MSITPILKYPRTPHLEGSRLQPGDEDLNRIPFSAVRGKNLVVEEKCDGANCAVSFDGDGTLLLQSRGHYLTGGYRERHYDLLKTWAGAHREAFYSVIGTRYIMYGEWMYAKHAIFYDALPHYFLEFDVFDRQSGVFLDTDARRKLLAPLPVVSVPVLAKGKFDGKKELLSLLGKSHYITPNHAERLETTCKSLCLDADKVFAETDDTDTMEGLYIKVEENGTVVNRLKFVRGSYSQQILDGTTPWIDRPIVPNGLTVPIDDLFLPKI